MRLCQFFWCKIDDSSETMRKKDEKSEAFGTAAQLAGHDADMNCPL